MITVIHDTLYMIMPMILSVAFIAVFAGTMYYMFSGDKAEYKQMALTLIIPSIVSAFFILLILIFLN